MRLKSRSIRQKQDEMKVLIDEFDTLVAGAQSHCAHRQLGECDYHPSEYFSALPPIRVCLTCGLSEEGWGCGYSILTNPSQRKISRQQLYSLRVGSTINQGD